jgi:hypothetical protein
VSRSSLCADTYDNPGDEYVGHDEPRWSSNPVVGSGNDITYTVTLPQDRTRAERQRRRDLELRAPANVLVRAHAL